MPEHEAQLEDIPQEQVGILSAKTASLTKSVEWLLRHSRRGEQERGADYRLRQVALENEP